MFSSGPSAAIRTPLHVPPLELAQRIFGLDVVDVQHPDRPPLFVQHRGLVQTPLR